METVGHLLHMAAHPKDLQDIKDKVPLLQIFAHKFRTGFLAANNKLIHGASIDTETGQALKYCHLSRGTNKAVTATSIGPLPREAAWITRQAKIHASIKRIPGVENIEADASSQLTHLPVHTFIKSFNTYFPQPTPWRLSHLPSGVTPRLHTMLLTKQSPKASPL